MKDYIERFKAWWQRLSTREKQAVSAGSALLAFFLVYEILWQPMLNHIQSLRQQIVSEQKSLVWMQSADKMLTKMNKETVRTKPVSLVVFLSQMQQEINQAGLASFVTQLKQSTNDSIEVHFQKVEFDKLMTFLIGVVRQHPVAVTQFSVIAGDSPGLVSADIVMNQG